MDHEGTIMGPAPDSVNRMLQRLTDGVTLFPGNCLDVLAEIEPNSIDAVVTDPPYELTQAKRTKPPPVGVGPYGRTRMGVNGDNKPIGGFMGKEWDGTGVARNVDLWREIFRVLKPGAHLLAFGGTRTYHRMACAIEDAGFEIRDCIQWLYGSGFPKSHDMSKAIDRAAGAERKAVGVARGGVKPNGGYGPDGTEGLAEADKWRPVTAPATAAARQWEGWGTALKPACEPIVLARKPLEGTIAQNVLKWGTGALNIDGCRVETNGENMGDPQRFVGLGNHEGWDRPHKRKDGLMSERSDERFDRLKSLGRWPAHAIHDSSEEVVAAFPDAPGQQYYVEPEHGERPSRGIYGDFGARPPNEPRGDSGSAARFFYTAKADADDRLGSKHPTVKPLDLMQYLVRLVTPPRGLVLDPFAGTGTTGEACIREGFRAVLIEREPEYQADIRRRIRLATTAGPDERAREAIKAKLKDKPLDHGPLFAADR